MSRPYEITRLAVLRMMAWLVPSSALLTIKAWGGGPISLEWPDDRKVATGVLRIILRLPSGHVVPPSTKVSVLILGRLEEVRPSTSDLVYEKSLKTGQSYAIRVEAKDYLTIERSVQVNGALEAVQVFLVRKTGPTTLWVG